MKRSNWAVRGVIATLLLSVSSCGSPGPAESPSLKIFAASSLKDVMDPLTEAYGIQHEKFSATVSYAGSARLVQQIQHGASADVLITADETALKPLQSEQLIETPSVIAQNRLTLITPADNPAGIESLEDLGRADVQVSLCSPNVPCGRSAAAATEGVKLRHPSEEHNVRSVLTKITSGQADAGLVYATDARAGGDSVEVIDIPDAPANRYPAAVLDDAEQKDRAEAFVKWLHSDSAQAILSRAGFEPSEEGPAT